MVLGRRLISLYGRLSDQPDSQSTASPSLSLVISKARRSRARLLGALAVFALVLLGIITSTSLSDYAIQVTGTTLLPPTYTEYRQREEAMVRTNSPDAQSVDVKTHSVKYFYPERHVYGVGIGNALQELLLNALVAYASNRSFVWDDYTWQRGPLPYANFGFGLTPASIPLSALIDGPIVGQSFSEGNYTPRSVTKEYFHEVCEHLGGIHYIDTDEVNHDMWWNENYNMLDVLNAWVERLESIDAPCISTGRSEKVIWEFWFFGSRRMWPLWPVIRDSPIMTEFSSSPLALLGVEANKHLLGLSRNPALAHVQSPISFSPGIQSSVIDELKAEQFDVIPGLLVLHIRRGDFSNHCDFLIKWRADWQGIIQLAADGMPDSFEQEKVSYSNWGTADVRPIYRRRCFPDIEQVVQRVRDVRLAHPHLKRIYVMTNGKKDWLSELRHALLVDSADHIFVREDGSTLRLEQWEAVHTSRELVLSEEQRYVAATVDAAIATRADVFIGNGWSSLTAHVVMLRMAKGLHKEGNRFW